MPPPPPPPPPPDPPSQSTSSYLSYPVSHVVSALYRRLTEPSPNPLPPQSTSQQQTSPTPPHSMSNGVYTPPHRTASPFQPPPLTPLSLVGFDPATSPSAQILSRALAEEIRLLVPPRLQLADTWSLVYSLEQDGVSLATLYSKCASSDLPNSSSFVLVIRDAAGGVRCIFPLALFVLRPSLSGLSIVAFQPPHPFPQFSNPKSTNQLADLRRISNPPPPALTLLLRHWRMFSLARFPPTLDIHSLNLSPSAPLGAHHRVSPSQHQDCQSDQPFCIVAAVAEP